MNKNYYKATSEVSGESFYIQGEEKSSFLFLKIIRIMNELSDQDLPILLVLLLDNITYDESTFLLSTSIFYKINNFATTFIKVVPRNMYNEKGIYTILKTSNYKKLLNLFGKKEQPNPASISPLFEFKLLNMCNIAHILPKIMKIFKTYYKNDFSVPLVLSDDVFSMTFDEICNLGEMKHPNKKVFFNYFDIFYEMIVIEDSNIQDFYFESNSEFADILFVKYLKQNLKNDLSKKASEIKLELFQQILNKTIVPDELRDVVISYILDRYDTHEQERCITSLSSRRVIFDTKYLILFKEKFSTVSYDIIIENIMNNFDSFSLDKYDSFYEGIL